MKYAAPEKPFTQEIKRTDDTSSFVRHVDARYSPESRYEAENILKGNRENKVTNRKYSILTMKDYSKGIPTVVNSTNQRQRRKVAAQNR